MLWAAAAIPKQRQAAQQKQIRQQQIQQAQIQMQVKEMQFNLPSEQAPVREEDVKDIVDMSQLLEALTQSSEAWSLIIDQEAKNTVITHFIEGFTKNGISITKSAPYYSQVIDAMTQTRPEMLQQPFPNLLQTIAIIEYDFNNGMDKDAMAQKVLGESAFAQNRQRLGLQP